MVHLTAPGGSFRPEAAAHGLLPPAAGFSVGGGPCPQGRVGVAAVCALGYSFAADAAAILIRHRRRWESA